MADLFAKVPPIVMQGLNSAGALLPSIGFGMLFKYDAQEKYVGILVDWIHLFCVWRNVNHWDLTSWYCGSILLRYDWK